MQTRVPVVVSLLALTFVGGSARAQTAPASTTMFEEGIQFRPKDDREKVTFSLEDADLTELLRAIGQLTGKKFLIATAKAKTFKATIFSPQKITVAEAYQAFLSTLSANALTVIPDHGFLRIVDTADVVRQNTPVSGDGATAEERYVTQVHRLTHIGAEEVATSVLSKFTTRDGSIVPYAAGNLLIMTDTGPNLRRMMRILEEVDVAFGSADKVYFEPIHYVSSADIEKKLSDILDLKRTGDAKTTAPAGGAGEVHVGRIVAVERPNALVIVATTLAYRRMLEIIKLIDVPVTGEGQINVVALQHSDAKKIVGPLNDAIGGALAAGAPAQGRGAGAPQAALAILESPVKISAEETTNSIIVTASPRDFAAIRAVIAKLDQPKRQVFIEAVVMDLTVSRATDIGVAYHGGTTTGEASDTLLFGGMNAGKSIALSADALQAFALGVRGPEISTGLSEKTGLSKIPGLGAFFSAVAVQKGADILSTPSILASDNTVAEIRVQLKVPTQPNAPPPSIIAGAAGLPSFGASTQSTQSIGPRVRITPHLNDSDEVRLDIDETISDVESRPDKSDVYGSVSFIERAATTTLTVKDNETIVIGGLVRNRTARSETKVPLLGDIPLLGVLFRSTKDETEKSNLVLVLTPHIIRDQGDMRRIYERKMQERQEMLDRATVFNETQYQPPKDYTHTRGLLGDIRRNSRDVDERKRLEELRSPRDLKTHEPREPLLLPAPEQTWGGSTGPTPKPPATPVPVPNTIKLER